MVWRGDDELAHRFVRGVIYRREPVAAFVGPVIAKVSAVAVFVVGYFETTGGNSFVENRIFLALTCLGRCLELNSYSVVFMAVFCGLAITHYAANGHAFAV